MSLKRVAPGAIRVGDEIELRVQRGGITTIRRIVVANMNAGMLNAVGGGMLDPDEPGEWFVRTTDTQDIVSLAETLAEIVEVNSAMDDPRTSAQARETCHRRMEAMAETVRGLLLGLSDRTS